MVLVCIRTLDRFFVLEGDDEGEERGRLEEEELLLVSTMMMMGFEIEMRNVFETRQTKNY